MSSVDPATVVTDRELPAASLLLSPGAIEVLSAALDIEGGAIRGLRPTRVSYRPGERIVVSYQVGIAWGSRASTETVVAMARRAGLPAGAQTVEVAGSELAVWRAPHDPYLPGLSLATDPEFVRGLLDQIGAPPGNIELRTRAYWPRLRAVIQVTTNAPGADERLVFRPGQGFARPGPISVVYLKVVPPSAAGKLERAHSVLATSVPVARCQHCDQQQGLLVLEPVSGESLWDCVFDRRLPAPDGHALIRLLEALEHAELPRSARMTSRESARAAAPLLRAVLPQEAARIDRFLDALGEDPAQPLITVHGDFHEFQVLVDRDGISGLLDLDDVGPGQRVDDLAMMAARFWSFAPFERRGQERIAQYALDLLETFARFADPDELDHRVAAVLLARATSPFRSQSYNWQRDTLRAIELAERWLDGSGRTIAAALSV